MRGTLPYKLPLLLLCSILALSAINLLPAQSVAPAPTPASDGTITVETTNGCGSITATLRTGKPPGNVIVELLWSDNSSTPLSFEAANESCSPPLGAGYPTGATTNLVLSDASISCPQLTLKMWVRPTPATLGASQLNTLLDAWESYQGAAEYRFPLLLRADAKGVEYWVDGRYVCRTDKAASLQAVRFRPIDGGEVANARYHGELANTPYLPLNLGRFVEDDRERQATIELAGGLQKFAGIPILLNETSEAIPLARENKRAVGRAASVFERHSATTAHFTLPLAQYRRAWLLSAVAPPADAATPEVSINIRLTRYTSDGRGDGVAVAAFKLPYSSKERAGSTIVGKALIHQQSGGVKVPLRLLELALPIAEIQDLLFFQRNEPYNAGMLADRRYLDCEVFVEGSAAAPMPQLFGLTLERAPVELELRSEKVGNIFELPEEPTIGVALKPRLAAGAFSLQWQLRDMGGQLECGGSRQIALGAGEEETFVAISLPTASIGWHRLAVALLDSSGGKVAAGHCSLALLPARASQPQATPRYGAWWNGTLQRGSDASEIGGPLLARAGLRFSAFPRHHLTQSDLAPWSVQSFAIPWLWRDSGNPLADGARFEEGVRNYLARFPSTDTILLGCDAAPLLATSGGAPPVGSEASATAAAQCISNAVTLLRASFPQLQRLYDNPVNGLQSVRETLANGALAPNEIDALRLGVANYMLLPEEARLQEFLRAKEISKMAEVQGHAIALTTAGEWLPRSDRVLGGERQAAWIARDILVAHAYGLRRISCGLLYDAGDAQYHTPAGSSALCRRYPLLQPKPAYVAVATLTRLLEGLRYTRQLATGSPSIYALEFRQDRRFVYALWCARGSGQLQLRFSERRLAAKLVSALGKESNLSLRSGKLLLQCDTLPQYLLVEQPLESIATVARAYPGDEPPSKRYLVNQMRKVDEWQLSEVSEAPERAVAVAPLALTTTRDRQHGTVLELTLAGDAFEANSKQSCVALLRLRQPQPEARQASYLGVWVGGNSGWGRVRWLFEDGEGRNYISSANGMGERGEYNDPNIDFDGWCFMRASIEQAQLCAPAPDAPLHPDDSAPRRPITPTALLIEFPRHPPALNDAPAVEQRIRLHELSLF